MQTLSVYIHNPLWPLRFADMDLNLQNLSLIGFRILLLKVVGFNLFMTLRLWSS